MAEDIKKQVEDKFKLPDYFGKNNLLLIIDPQIDFTERSGSLYVPHAEEGMANLCKFIDIHRKKINSIVCTADSHYPNSIFNPSGWRNKDGEILDPYTKISSKEVEKGIYTPVCTTKEDAITYLQKLEAQGNQHIIWPEHCLVKSKGQSFPDILIRSLSFWCKENNKIYGIFEKGASTKREMYSAFSYADGSAPQEGKHRLDLLDSKGYDKIFIAGFAKDYCVAESVRDLYKDGRFKNKLVFLPRCMATINSKNPSLSIYEEAVKNYGAVEDNLI